MKRFLIISWNFLLTLLKKIYLYTGAAFIVSKARFYDESPKEKLPTLPLWILGIYFAAFSVAFQQYESKLDLIENKTTIVMALAGTSNYKHALEQIPSIQSMKSPTEPSIFNPLKTIKSIMLENRTCIDHINTCKELNSDLERLLLSFINRTRKSSTDTKPEIDLSNIDITGIILGSRLKKIEELGDLEPYSGPSMADLELELELQLELAVAGNTSSYGPINNLAYIIIKGGEFNRASLDRFNFSHADLTKSSFSSANLRKSLLLMQN